MKQASTTDDSAPFQVVVEQISESVSSSSLFRYGTNGINRGVDAINIELQRAKEATGGAKAARAANAKAMKTFETNLLGWSKRYQVRLTLIAYPFILLFC